MPVQNQPVPTSGKVQSSQMAAPRSVNRGSYTYPCCKTPDLTEACGLPFHLHKVSFSNDTPSKAPSTGCTFNVQSHFNGRTNPKLKPNGPAVHQTPLLFCKTSRLCSCISFCDMSNNKMMPPVRAQPEHRLSLWLSFPRQMSGYPSYQRRQMTNHEWLPLSHTARRAPS
jgi:hypothetical protein